MWGGPTADYAMVTNKEDGTSVPRAVRPILTTAQSSQSFSQSFSASWVHLWVSFLFAAAVTNPKKLCGLVQLICSELRGSEMGLTLIHQHQHLLESPEENLLHCPLWLSEAAHIPWLLALHHSKLCFCGYISFSDSLTSHFSIKGLLWLQWAQPANPGPSPYLQILTVITSAEAG